MICTFIDSAVLIVAARAEDPISEMAMQILEDPSREFASSIFLKLEVLPKAIYNQRIAEVRFYEEYFNSVLHWATNLDEIIHNAYHIEASQSGLGAMDALHIAAVSVGAVEFITAEKAKSSIPRTNSIRIISISPN
ncbi:MAG: nucleic acid-binding protein [Nostoc sp. S4]|nr:nucleic acid-binding protein [Nostoc sp. S4]